VRRGRREDVPEHYRQTREVLDTGAALRAPTGRVPPGVPAQPGHPATTRLAALLDPLADNPDLLPTLELYRAEDLNRRRTATAPHLHPSTVDYRLRRVVALTGLDPARPQDLRHIGAAMAARRVIGFPLKGGLAGSPE
jgi:hypothetical protein